MLARNLIMRNASWEALLKHIPADLQCQYMIVTSSGVEIAVQNFLRIESEILVFKGRLSGSQDQGILFFLPYTHIDYVGTSKSVKDSEFAETFGSFTFPKPAPEPPPQAVPAEPPRHAEAAVSPSARPAPEAKPTIRSEVLERFRNRSSGSSLNLPSPPQQP